MSLLATSQRLPLTVQLQQNELLSRSVLEAVGDTAPTLILSRNNYERLENFIDWAAWIVASIGVPYFLLGPVARVLEKKSLAYNGLAFLHKHRHPHQSLLHLPLEVLDQAHVTHNLRELSKKAALGEHSAQTLLKKTGLQHFDQITPRLSKQLLGIKLGIIYADLLALACKGQVIQFFKNWLTEKLSGKSGFSGIMGYASDAYRDRKADVYKQSEKQRRRTSFALGFGAALTFPTLLSVVLLKKNPGKIMQALKKKTHYFNYTDILFMKKPTLAVHNLFNFVLPTLMACRDSNELREKGIRMAIYDFFFFFGDDLLGGAFAAKAQKKQALETNLLKAGKIPRLRPLNAIVAEAGVHSQAYRVARKSFWGGLLGASFLLSVCVRLANFAYTRHRVLEEEKRLKQKALVTTPQQHNLTSINPGITYANSAYLIESSVFLPSSLSMNTATYQNFSKPGIKNVAFWPVTQETKSSYTLKPDYV